MKPVDCHCHLDFKQFDGDRDEVIKRAKEKLDFLVTVGCNPEKNKKTVDLCQEHPDLLVPNLGLHPTYSEKFDEIEKVKEQIRRTDPSGIGEIGLDHHHVKTEDKRDRQEQVFRELLELAEKTGKPVNIHSRDAEQAVLEIIQEYDLKNVLIHCFNGNADQARRATDYGAKIGVTTQVLYSGRIEKLVGKIELENLVLETDSPYLYPDGRNEPVKVVEAAEKVAEIKSTSIKEVVQTTTRTARDLFR